MSRIPSLVLVGCAALLPGLVALATPQAFAAPPAEATGSATAVTHTIVADSLAHGLDPYGFGCATINDRGDVGFRAARLAPNGFDAIEGIYRADAGRDGLVTVAQNRRRFAFLGYHPSLNNARKMSFAALLSDGGEAVLRGAGGPLTTIARTAPGRFEGFGFDTSIDPSGRVAFAAALDEPRSFDRGLFSGDGTTIETHYLSSRTRFDGSAGRPSVNARDRIAFRDSVQSAHGVFVARPDGIRAVAAPAAAVSVGDPQLNGVGQVAFERSYDDPDGTFVSEIVAGRIEPLAVVADTRADLASFGYRPPALTDAGAVAYQASLDDGSTAVFLDHLDGAVDPAVVVRTGDLVDGDPVTNVVFCEEGLNERGQLTFSATLDDLDAPGGLREVIVRSTPVP